MPGDPASGADPCSINCERAPYWTCGRCTLQNVWPVPEFFLFLEPAVGDFTGAGSSHERGSDAMISFQCEEFKF